MNATTTAPGDDRSTDPAFGDDTLHDVAIIGYGPTGATLANLLALRGLSVLVLEREADIYRLPRAVHFDGECMRTFQALGVADALLPKVFASKGQKFIDAAGRVLLDFTKSVEIGPQAWHPSYRFHQPDLETILRERLAGFDRVQVRQRHDVFALETRTDHVELRVEDMRSGRLLRGRARYVVGCDGARSLVRRFMGTELDDMRSHERWIVVDVLLERERPDLGDYTLQICDPARPSTYVRGVGRRRRWELMLMPGDDPNTIARPESIWPLLSRWVSPADGQLERPALYTFHSVVARGWRNDRLLIAGDAAHQTPPFMGQGLCAGIRDAMNLAWKLDDVIRGAASPRLLDSYESERSPHVREFIATAVRLGGIIQATDPEVARQRDERMAANPETFHSPQPAIGPGAWRDDGFGGRLSAQPRAADGRRLDDRIGYRHALIVRPDLAAGVGPAEAHCAVVVATEPEVAGLLADAGAGALLLRPDRQIAAGAVDAQGLPSLLELSRPARTPEPHRATHR